MSYEYTDINRLDKPHSYMYTPYGGLDFLIDYLDSRQTRIQDLIVSDNDIEILSLDRQLVSMAYSRFDESFNYSDIDKAWCEKNLNGRNLNNQAVNVDEFFLRWERKLHSFDNDSIIETEELLYGILESLFNPSFNQPDLLKKWVDSLVQRFEVTKKLYFSYLPGFRKGCGSTRILHCYWLFGIVLTIYYLETNNLKYLNALLKINDMLCSIPVKDLVEEVTSIGMVFLLVTEVLITKVLFLNSKGNCFVLR